MSEYEDFTRIPEMVGKVYRALFEADKHYRYIVFYGGRGGGKSESIAQGLAIKAAHQRKVVLCGRQFQNSTDESVKSTIEEWIDTLAACTDYAHLMSGYKIGKNQITHTNGSIFRFWGLERRIRALKSFKGIDIFWGEEASDFTHEVIKKLLPTIRKPGSQFILSYNPDQEDDAVHSLFTEEKRYEDETLLVPINYFDNPFCPDELLNQARHDKARSYEEYLHIWEGHTQYLSDRLVFNNCWKKGKPVPKEDTVFYYGMDFGFAVDPLAIIRCWIDEGKKELYIDHAYSQVGVALDDHDAFIRQMPGADVWTITADSARPEIISKLQSPGHGFRVKGAIKGPNSIIEGIAFLKNYTIIIHERLEKVIREFSTYSYKIDKRTLQIIPEPADKQADHFIDALRYALEDARCVRVIGATL